MKTKVYLIRHGAAQHTGNSIFAGVTDSKLVALGEKQAYLLAKKMSKERIDVIFSSPLQRALRTAEIIFPNRKINVVEDLHERDCGVMEFKPMSMLTKKQREDFEKTGELRVKGAETVSQAQRRGYSVLMKIYRKHKGQNIAIVAHNDILKAMVSAAVKCPYVSIRFYNSSMSKLDDYGGRWNIEVLNDVPEE